jgi:hypothetical protein
MLELIEQEVVKNYERKTINQTAKARAGSDWPA